MNMPSPRSWKHRHYGDRIVFITTAVALALLWVNLPKALQWVTSAVFTFALVSGIVLSRAHSTGGLCESCIQEMSLNTGRAVDRSKLWLWGAHQLNDGKRQLIMPVIRLVLFIAMFVWSLIDKDEKIPFNILLTTTLALSLVDMQTYGVHRRLRPWCLYCRNDGDDDESVVDPDPVIPQTV